MNAPVRRSEATCRAPADTVLDGPVTWAKPRHVMKQGCQFLVGSGLVLAGDRKAFAAPDGTWVTGTIQWVVKDRIGFAFDQSIGQSVLAALTQYATMLTALELSPLPEPAD